ncbi:hypothetical protein EAO70_27045 [Streptomyces sp. adm13(2018)]|nr:hypothetical protein EAO70_27045 [Streptomyces sp. adm13(2018)]
MATSGWARKSRRASWPRTAMPSIPPGMITADGADHRRLRTLVSSAFTARRAYAPRGRPRTVCRGRAVGEAAS